MKQWIIIGAVVLVLLASYLWNRSANQDTQGEELPPLEEVIVREDGQVVRKTGDVEEVLSEEEAQVKKQEIEEKLSTEEAESAVLAAVDEQAGEGSSVRVYQDGTYYQKITVENLPPAQKGYYYEAWLEKPDSSRISLGRIDASTGNGELVYSSNDDKTEYTQYVVSYEMDDGNAEVGEVVLRGRIESAQADSQEEEVEQEAEKEAQAE